MRALGAQPPLLAVVCCLLSYALSTDAAGHFYLSPRTSFVVANDRALDPASATYQLKTLSFCECRRMCKAVVTNCTALSYDSSGECLLAEEPGNHTKSIGARYLYEVKAKKERNKLYYYVHHIILSNALCKAACFNRAGFRLPMAKDAVTMALIREYDAAGLHHWVGLHRNLVTNALTWEDGTPMNRTASGMSALEPYINLQSEIFGTWAERIDDAEPQVETTCICTGNFDGVAW